MYNRIDIERFANETNFIRDNVEKVVRLCDILKQLNTDPIFSDNLALKGGTAINLLVTPLARLSVDIDLDFTDNCDKSLMIRKRKIIGERLDTYLFSEGYRRNPHSKSPLSIDSWIYQYTNTVGNLDNIKIEINYSMRCHILPTENKPILIPRFADYSVKTFNLVELYATKIKALLERGAARDLFDVYNMIENNIIDVSNNPLLKKSVIFYSVVGGSNLIGEEYSMTPIENIQFRHIKASLLPVLKKGTFFELDKTKTAVVNYLTELMTLTEKEREFIQSFTIGYYRPELLFDDDAIIDRVKNHPMAKWKTQHTQK